MKYSAWGKGDTEFTFVSGVECPEENMELLQTFEAESWEDAMRQYHEWQGWESYKAVKN